MTRNKPIDEAEFRRICATDASTEEIAEHFDMLTSSVRRKRRRLGIAPPPRVVKVDDPELHEAMRVLIAKGMTRPEVAKELGIGLYMASQIRRKAGLPRFYQPPPPRGPNPSQQRIDRELVQQLSEEKVPVKRIAEVVGAGPRQVERIRTELGIAEPSTPYPPEVRLRAFEMLEDGASYRQVAETLKIGNSVRNGGARVAVWFPGMGWSQEQTSEYRNMLRQLEQIDGTRVDRRVYR